MIFFRLPASWHVVSSETFDEEAIREDINDNIHRKSSSFSSNKGEGKGFDKNGGPLIPRYVGDKGR